jgi:hypothetical protein
VPEAGLDDLDGFAVPDQKRCVVVAERVEAGAGRCVRRLHGFAPGIREPGAADRLAALVGEDKLVVVRRVLLEVTGERVGDGLRERDGADARVGLGRREERRTVLHEHELLHDVEAPAEEVDVRDSEPERFALSHPGSRREDHQSAVAVRRVGDRKNSVGLERLDALALDLGERDAIARTDGDEPVGDRALEDGREVAVHDLDRRRLHPRRELLDEGLDLRAPDRTDRLVLEAREDVVAHVRVDLHLCRRSVDARRLPLARVLTEPLLAARGIDVGAVREVPPDGVEPLLGVTLLCKAAGSLAAVRRAIAGAPRGPSAPVALLDVGHGCSDDTTERSGSGVAIALLVEPAVDVFEPVADVAANPDSRRPVASAARAVDRGERDPEERRQLVRTESRQSMPSRSPIRFEVMVCIPSSRSRCGSCARSLPGSLPELLPAGRLSRRDRS